MKEVLFVLMAVICLTGCKQQDQTSPRTFLIPHGYIGWDTVHNDKEAESKSEYTVDEKMKRIFMMAGPRINIFISMIMATEQKFHRK
ncbi:hypothetical protein [Metabacillus idriensis]|uniref:hypothetical protein n=1 Tax=Metabacillus idriensis TaxID=324768 RepID=UPI00174B7103|nr:hypothetical protein [Metabacillus idriensis]